MEIKLFLTDLQPFKLSMDLFETVSVFCFFFCGHSENMHMDF